MKEVTLAELREICGKTQVQLSKAMKVSQSMVSQIESKANLRLSTLRNYVEALGYELEIFAEFPQARYRLNVDRSLK